MPLKNNRDLAETSYVWDVEDFAHLEMVACPGVILKSPRFNSRNREKAWEFYMYPKGKSNEDYISFYLSKLYPSNRTVYNCKLSIGRPGAMPVKSYKYTDIRFLGNIIGEEFFLLKKSNSWILRGPIRFRCCITEIGPKNHDLTHAPSFNPFAFHLNIPDIENLSLNLEELMKLPFHSDLTVNISGQELYIHKYILYARCPNLSYEFGYSNIMEMPPTVEIEISDEIFELLIYYIYTGKLRDSDIPLELFRYAERLGLSSLMQCVHEQSYSYYVNSGPNIENKVISWNLDELNFLEEGSTCVHVIRTTLYAEQLAIQVRVSDGCGNEKFIHVSFQYFKFHEFRPITLICKISLTSQAGLEAFKKEHHVFLKDEQWNFPQLQCKKDKEYKSILGMCLIAELSMSDGIKELKPKEIKTKIKLHTDFQTVTENLEYLQSSMGFLFQMAQSTSNLILLSADNKFFRVHDGIMWARWPGVRKLIDRSSVSSDEQIYEAPGQLEVKLPSKVLNILLPYLYTGFVSNFNPATAQVLLKHSNYPEFPHHLVKKCEALLSDNHGNQR